MVQFNSFYGCGQCEQKAITVAKGNGTVRVFPFANPPARIRSDGDIAQQARQAVETGNSEKGVKGPSAVASIPFFSVAKGFVTDYMHCVLLGVVRSMLNLWVDSSYHQSPWYIGTRVRDIDQRLLSVQPPNIITRTPRSLTTRKYWKASEYRTWLLWYAIPVLQGILQTPYLQHFMLLCISIYLLVSRSVSKRNVLLAKHLLDSYVEKVQTLYGTEHCSFNVHQLIHLPLRVQRWGPLWVYSAFPFEDTNQILKQMIHSTQAAHLQVVGALAVTRKLKNFTQQVDGDEEAIHLAAKVSGKRTSRNQTRLDADCSFVDNGSKEVLEGPASEAAFRFIGTPMDHEVFVHKRAVVGSWMVHSRRYEQKGDNQQLKRNNSTVYFMDGPQLKIGKVEYFFKDGDQGYAIINRLNSTSQKFVHQESKSKMEQLTCVRQTNDLIVVKLSSIVETGIWMEIADKIIIGRLPNIYEYNL
ncbi:hypothetical protein HOLleu_03078 [Holothuria leucospilota]|uniref:Uncharacterized protein n=1 Tax=Holothuria leucospilota TaxID=206669 RepID=A0A9Q1CRH7_HOLLE|nr:hypothetical protein HOLleu_03078 [Holothuria leucospilota]